MAETTNKKVVVRRGIGSARGVERLRFTHEKAQSNGLFIAHLDDVQVRMITIGAETTGMPSFNGMEIPQLVFTFASNEPEANKRQYTTLRFTAVESNIETIPGGKKDWTVNTVFDWVKHILDTFVLKGRELTEEEEVKFSLPFQDFDENGEYVSVEPEEVIKGWTTLFENVAGVLNGVDNDGKKVYQDVNGKPLPLWIKLLRYEKRPDKSNRKNLSWVALDRGELTIPTFVGSGCIELFKQNVAPAIRINAVKECITPMKLEENKQPNMPNTAMGGNVMLGATPQFNDPFGGGIADSAMDDDMGF